MALSDQTNFLVYQLEMFEKDIVPGHPVYDKAKAVHFKLSSEILALHESAIKFDNYVQKQRETCLENVKELSLILGYQRSKMVTKNASESLKSETITSDHVRFDHDKTHTETPDQMKMLPSDEAQENTTPGVKRKLTGPNPDKENEAPSLMKLVQVQGFMQQGIKRKLFGPILTNDNKMQEQVKPIKDPAKLDFISSKQRQVDPNAQTAPLKDDKVQENVLNDGANNDPLVKNRKKNPQIGILRTREEMPNPGQIQIDIKQRHNHERQDGQDEDVVLMDDNLLEKDQSCATSPPQRVEVNDDPEVEDVDVGEEVDKELWKDLFGESIDTDENKKTEIYPRIIVKSRFPGETLPPKSQIFASEGSILLYTMGDGEIGERVMTEEDCKVPVISFWVAPMRHFRLGYRRTKRNVFGWCKRNRSHAAYGILRTIKYTIWKTFGSRRSCCSYRHHIRKGAYFRWRDVTPINLYAQDVFTAQCIKMFLRNEYSGEGVLRTPESKHNLRNFLPRIKKETESALEIMKLLPEISHPDFDLFTRPVKKVKPTEPMKCTVCSRVFAKAFRLYRHLRNVHKVQPVLRYDPPKHLKVATVTDFICSVCGKKLSCSGSLKTHMTNIHKNTVKNL